MSVKVYTVDIETTPLLVRTWSMWKPTIQASNIIEDRRILCIAWKEVGAKSARSSRVGAGKTEREMIAEFRAAIDDADILVGHNLDGFDMKHVTAKLIEYDLPPFQKLHTIDTLKEVRRVAKFSSNRLDFLCGKLLGSAKHDTDMQLWIDCMAGDEKALDRMERYCRNDVVITEALYLKLRPYFRNHPNIAPSGSMACPRCASEAATVRKAYRTKAGVERAHVHCLACSAPYTISPKGPNRPHSAV